MNTTAKTYSFTITRTNGDTEQVTMTDSKFDTIPTWEVLDILLTHSIEPLDGFYDGVDILPREIDMLKGGDVIAYDGKNYRYDAERICFVEAA